MIEMLKGPRTPIKPHSTVTPTGKSACSGGTSTKSKRQSARTKAMAFLSSSDPTQKETNLPSALQTEHEALNVTSGDCTITRKGALASAHPRSNSVASSGEIMKSLLYLPQSLRRRMKRLQSESLTSSSIAQT